MNIKKYGFTLLEVLVAVTIMGGLSVVLAQAFIATSRGSVKSEIVTDIKQGGDFAVRIMEQMIRSTTGILTPCNGTPSTSIQIKNPDGGITTFQCIPDNVLGITRIASVSGTTQNLTPTNVTLGGGTNCSANAMSLRFVCTQFPGQPSAVQIQFSLGQRGTPADKFEQANTAFQTTVNVRN